MLEFVIARSDGDGFFDLPFKDWPQVLRSHVLPTEVSEESQIGNHVIEVGGYRIRLVDEMPGLAVSIESEDMPNDLAHQVVAEILHNIAQATGSTYVLHEMPTDKPYRFA